MEKLTAAIKAGRLARDTGQEVTEVRELLAKARAAFDEKDYETSGGFSDRILTMLRGDPATTSSTPVPPAKHTAQAASKRRSIIGYFLVVVGVVLLPVSFVLAYVSAAYCSLGTTGVGLIALGSIMAKQTGRASLEELTAMTVIRPTESVLGTWWGKRSDTSPEDFYALLTSERLIFIQKSVRDVIEFQEITGVSGPSKVGRIVVSATHDGRSLALGFQPKTKTGHRRPDEFAESIQAAIRNRLGLLDREKKESRVQYLLDFSFLKAKMEQGGLSLTAIKCPSCGSPLELPVTGNTTACKFCGSHVRAQDIFEKLRGFVGDLP